MCVCVSLRTTVVYNTAQHSSDDFPSYPSDNHHSSDDVYRMGGGTQPSDIQSSKSSNDKISQVWHCVHTVGNLLQDITG